MHRLERAEALDRLEPGLSLARLARLVAEAVDKGLHVLALNQLAAVLGGGQGEPLAALLFEAVVVAAIGDQAAAVEMEDGADHRIEQRAVVADQEHRAAIGGKKALEPEPGLEVEMVAGLVEEQQVGRGKQQCGNGDAHPPAAGEGVQRAGLRRLVEAQPGEDGGGARRGGLGGDVGEADVDLGDPRGIVRGFGLGQQGGALGIGAEHEVA